MPYKPFMLLLDRHAFRAGKSYVLPQFSLTLLRAHAEPPGAVSCTSTLHLSCHRYCAWRHSWGTACKILRELVQSNHLGSPIWGSCSHYIGWGYH